LHVKFYQHGLVGDATELRSLAPQCLLLRPMSPSLIVPVSEALAVATGITRPGSLRRRRPFIGESSPSSPVKLAPISSWGMCWRMVVGSMKP
jgi:hypothetical protein